MHSLSLLFISLHFVQIYNTRPSLVTAGNSLESHVHRNFHHRTQPSVLHKFKIVSNKGGTFNLSQMYVIPCFAKTNLLRQIIWDWISNNFVPKCLEFNNLKILKSNYFKYLIRKTLRFGQCAFDKVLFT